MQTQGLWRSSGSGCEGSHVHSDALCAPERHPQDLTEKGKAALSSCAPNLHLLLAIDPHVHQHCLVLSGHSFLDYIQDH